jgi:hypothetical protein
VNWRQSFIISYISSLLNGCVNCLTIAWCQFSNVCVSHRYYYHKDIFDCCFYAIHTLYILSTKHRHWLTRFESKRERERESNVSSTNQRPYLHLGRRSIWDLMNSSRPDKVRARAIIRICQSVIANRCKFVPAAGEWLKQLQGCHICILSS